MRKMARDILRVVILLATLGPAPLSALGMLTKLSRGVSHHAPVYSVGQRIRRLQLRGGGAVPELVVPDSYDTLERALEFCAADKTLAEAQVTFRAGNYSIGTIQCNNMAVVHDRDEFRLRVRGAGAGTSLAGSWRCAGGGGELENARLLDVELLADCNYDGEFLHPGIMYGDCCIAVTGSRPWIFRDCEVQCSGTALRAYDDADVTCERLVTGGSSISKLPPSNIYEMKMAPWLQQLLIENLDSRNKTTGLPLYPESSFPRYGFTAWGRAHVRLINCRILNMSLNGVSASENATMEVHSCSISGSGMAAVYLEGSCNVTLTHSHLHDNLCCLSVWGGYGEERWLKTVGTDPREEEDVVVTPFSSLTALHNTLVGIIWAGATRPMHFLEEGNELQEEGDEYPDDDEEVPFYLDSAEFDNKTKVSEMWDIYEPISIPKWAPKDRYSDYLLYWYKSTNTDVLLDRIGGDGVVQWGPSEGVIDRDPFVLDDVRFGPGLGLKEEVEEIEEEEAAEDESSDYPVLS